MSEIPISTLPLAISITGAEYAPIVQGGTTKRVAASLIAGLYAGAGVASAQSANTILAGPSSGSAAAPSFRAMVVADLPTVTVPFGGTGRTTLTNHGVLVGAGAAAVTQLGAASVGTILTGQGAGADPSFSATPQLGASGTLGSLTLGNATSGLLTLQTVTGTLGTVTLSLPAATDTLIGRATTDILTNKTATGLAFTAGSTSVAPMTLASGTNLTSAVAGAVEFDGVQLYGTIDTTSGRAAFPLEQYCHLTANGSAISTIANFFGSTSNISIVASGYYLIDMELWYTVVTGTQTVTWTLTNSAAPTSQNIHYEMSPITGVVAPPGTATYLEGDYVNDATAARTIVTGALSAASHVARIHIVLKNGTGTSLKIQATSSANSITPLLGSFWRCRRVSPNNIGIFAA